MEKALNHILFLAMAMIFNPGLSGQESSSKTSGEYLGQNRPDLQPEIFAPGIVSKVGEYEFGSVFSADGHAFYYGVDVRGLSEIRYMLCTDGVWSDPQRGDFCKGFSCNDPFLSPDGDKLYFISDMPVDGSILKKDIDIWYVNKEGESWSEPINAGEMINSDKDEYYISFTRGGRIYFASNAGTSDSTKWNFDIYRSDYAEGAFQKPEKLSDHINTDAYEADVFIAPDESYIIFCSVRESGLGEGDLYISFKEDDSWTPAINMGESINTSGHELCPFVSHDGKYFFYTSNKDIYWVDAGIIETLRSNKL